MILSEKLVFVFIQKKYKYKYNFNYKFWAHAQVCVVVMFVQTEWAIEIHKGVYIKVSYVVSKCEYIEAKIKLILLVM